MAGQAALEVAGAAAAHGGGVELLQVVALLGAGVVAVPLFKRLGLGSVLGYLAAGLVLGPFGFRLVEDPQAVLHVAELGVVMFLFIVGLEMEPTKLWNLRKQIFGLGVAQVALCGALLTGIGVLMGFAPAVAFVFGLGFVLTSTAIVMQVMGERGELNTGGGQKVVSILLLEDLAIVPLLGIVALLAPGHDTGEAASPWIGIGIAAACLAGLGFAGRWVLNPLFRILAQSKAREVMTAAALLVVLGAAYVMQLGGLSMAMGAFIAGVLLSTSTFRHQLEADVEPFRGLLLGLFFLAVGMSLDLAVVWENWQLVALAVVGFMVVKGLAIYGLARFLKSSHAEALDRAALMAQGGEFAFVLFTTAASSGLIDGETNAVFTATVIISMVLSPLVMIAVSRMMPRLEPSMDGIDLVDGLTGQILVIGFGRFGQIASQPLLAKGCLVSIIDNDVEMIRAAGQFGMKVYYGDGTRLDILHAAGAGNADAILVCTDRKEQTTRIVELLKAEFPLVKVLARAYDRGHAIELLEHDVDFQIREVLESALQFGGEAMRMLGVEAERVDEILEGVRRRDAQRFEAQMLGGLTAGRDLLISNAREQAEEGGVGGRESEPVILDQAASAAPKT